MVPADWIEHRRPSDGELLGWLVERGELWVPVWVLGHPVSDPVDWSTGEQILEDMGLAALAEVWTLTVGGEELRVRIVQVAPDGIVVQTDDFGAIDLPVDRFDLPWPAPPELRPVT